MSAILAKLDDGIGLAIVKQLSVLGLKHVKHCANERSERHLQQASHLLSVVKEAVDRLDARLLHVLLLSRDGL